MNNRVISNIIFEQAYHKPKKQAILMPDGLGATYGDVVNAYKQVENFLKSKHIEPAARTALISSENLALALLTLPLLEQAVAVPIDSDYSKEQLAEALARAKTSYVFTDKADSAAAVVAEELGLGLVLFELAGEAGNLSIGFNMIHYPQKTLTAEGFKCPDISLVLMTSGTTDQPKIVPVKYDSITASLFEMAEYYQYDDNIFLLSMTKLSIFVSYNNMLRVLISGGRVMLAGGLKFNEIADLLTREAITTFTASPAFFRVFVENMEKQPAKIKPAALQYVCCAGASLSEPLRHKIEKALGVPVLPYYGMTEALAITSSYRSIESIKNGSVGLPVGTEVKIVNGEILVKGPKVFQGYETVLGLDRSAFSGNWFHTGDLGYADEAGNLYLTGRINEMINRGGEKVSPFEVESALENITGVKEAVVFPWNSSKDLAEVGFAEVGAAVVFTPDAVMNLREIRRHLSGNITPYKMPTLLYTVKSIPRGGTGKPSRKKLYQALKDEYSGEYIKPCHVLSEEDIERMWKDDSVDLAARLKLLWSVIFNLDCHESIGLDDNFFELGGDSLAAVAMLSAIDDQFNIQVPTNDFYGQPTINNLVNIVNRSALTKHRFKYLVPLTISGQGAPLFCVHPLSGEIASNRFLGEYIEDRPVYCLRFENMANQSKGPLGISEIARSYLNEIAHVWPEGPYLFYGTCLGALIAVEMAQQMREQDKRVEFIALFDPIVSRTKKTIPARIKNQLTEKIIHTLREVKGLSAGRLAGFFSRKTQSLFKLAKRESLEIRYELTGAQSGKEFSRKEILLVAARRSRRRLIKGKVYYFKPTVKFVRSDMALEGWRGFIEDLELIPVPGSHLSMQQREGMLFIANEINRILKGMGL